MAKLVIFSGAGLSAESGVPTFRGGEGAVWAKYDLDIVCNFRTWKSHRQEVYEFYNMRRAALETVQPNSAHHMIADWQKRYKTIILTQNIDDLLERAGCTDVIHLHGHAERMRCLNCHHNWAIGYSVWTIDDCCPKCGSKKAVKPDVVFFHEEAPRYSDLHKTLKTLQDDDVVVVTGTSGAVIAIDILLEDRNAYKICNGLEVPHNPGVYDQLVLQPATTGFVFIDQILRDKLG